MRHAQCQAFLEAAVLALVAILLLDLAAPLTLLIFQLHSDCPTEEALRDSAQVRKIYKERREVGNPAAHWVAPEGPIIHEVIGGNFLGREREKEAKQP